MIEIEALTYTYPQQTQPTLLDVHWQVAAGTFVLVTGPSGAGKSTLLRCLNGLVPHFSGGQIAGRVLVNGLDVVQTGPAIMSQQVGFVLQSPEAQAVLDRVEPEIAFGLENAAVSPHLMHQRVNQVLHWLDLIHLRERPIHTLSGGERQRVAIATALALQPTMLVLDEPTSQLDPQAAAEVLQAIVRLNKQQGLTVILAEHRLNRVLPFADRLVVVEAGRITADVALTDEERRLREEELWHPAAAGSDADETFSAEVLAIQGLRFAYDSKQVLKDVHLTVKSGEAVAIMGHNGAGKSTLLKCIVNLLPVGQGEIRVNGRLTHDQSTAEICQEVAYLPQNPDDLLFAESVEEELSATLRNHGLEQRGARSAGIARMLEELGLSGLEKAYPRDLSVGQRQRVALGAVTVTEPSLLLLDEPTRGLDSQAKQHLAAIWRRWLAQGMGLLLVTHDAALVSHTADRVIILEDGLIKAEGATADILAHFYADPLRP